MANDGDIVATAGVNCALHPADARCGGVTLIRDNQSDRHGSIVAVADAGGTPIAINSYDEYGIPFNTATSDSRPYGSFGYTGQIWLADAGFYHYKARIYSPTLGRFLQTDPVGAAT